MYDIIIWEIIAKKRGSVCIKDFGAKRQFCPCLERGSALLFHSPNMICCTQFTMNRYSLQYSKER